VWSATHKVTAQETARLTALYREASDRVMTALASARAKGNNTAHLTAVRAQIDAMLADLRTGSHQWTREAFPRSYMAGVDGIDGMLVAAGVTAAPAAFAGIHTQAVQVLADNAYNRLSDVTNVIGRQVDDTLRAYALDAITGPAFGVGTVRSAQSDIFTRIANNMDTAIRQRADGSTYLGFQVTPDGKFWSVDTYAEMVARTTLADTMRTGSQLRMAEAGIESFQVIGGPDPCEDCQTVIDGGPYTSSEIDELMADSGHFCQPNCECAIVADTAALDEMG
jgi:hypothetical protein